MNTATSNPWSNLVSTGNYYCCKNDEEYVKYLLTLPKYQKDLKMTALPDPYNGNPEAPVYILNGNPGFNPADILFASNPNFQHLTDDNLNHRCSRIIYADNITIGSTLHPGCEWWQSRIRRFRHKENLFNIELFPYHSKSFLDNLIFPSFKYTKELVLDAMAKNKPIILRGSFKICWFSAVPELLSYGGELYVTTEQRTIHFTEPKIKNYPQMHAALF